MTRRKMVKGVIAGGALAVTGRSVLAESTTAATTQVDAITVEDLAIADRVEGRSFTEAERKMMVGGMKENREKLKSLRSRHIEPGVEPAIQFNPRVKGVGV